MQKILKHLLLFLFWFFIGNFCIATTLPSGYTQLEYIETTGTTWIDTGIYGNLNTSFEIVVQTTVAPTEDIRFVPFGSRQSATESNIMVLIDVDNKVLTDFGDYTETRLQASVDNIMNKFKIYNSRSSRYIQDLTSNTTHNNTESYSTNFTTPTTLRIAAVGPGFHVLQKNFIGKVYYVKIWDDNILVRDFVPAKRNSDNEIGMYDTVNNMFYTNAGTGTFIAGPAICAATATALDEQICLKDIQPNGLYLPVKYNNNKYYLMLDATHDYPIHQDSDNKLKIKVGNTTYNVHDASVFE